MFDVEPITSERATDCGATCLKMLLDYYGIEVDINQLIIDCNTRLIGCTAKDVMVAGRLHGMDMHAYKTDVDGILNVDRPAIIFWKKKHFCVFCGIDDDGSIVIANPDRGRYRMSKSLFKAWYSNIALFNGVPEDVDGQEIIDVYENIFRP